MEKQMFRIPGHQQRTFDTPIQVILASIAGLLLGLIAVTFKSSWILIGFLAILMVILTVRRPELSVLTILLFLSTVIPDARIPIINVGPGRLYITELIFLLLFVIFVVRWLTIPTVKVQHTPLDLPLLLFVFCAVITTIWSVLHNNVLLQHAIPELRVIFYYLLFFIVTNLITEKKNIKLLLQGINWFATIVALGMIVQYMLGSSIPILEGRVEFLSDQSGITRITDTPGEALITLVVIINLIRLLNGKLDKINYFDIIQLLLISTALIMTFNRTHWVMVIISGLIAVIFINWHNRKRILYWGIVLFFLIMAVVSFAVINPQTSIGKLLNSTFNRGLTILQLDSYQENDQSTLRWRDFEYKYGFPQIAKHPLFGMGLGAEYRPRLYEIDHANFNGQLFTHNAHLWLAIKTGLISYSFFMIFIIVFIWRGIHFWRKVEDIDLRNTLLGITIAMFATLIGANIHPFYMTLFWTPLIGVLIGVGENIIRLEQKSV
ncbi:MAG: hypothetical protein CL609_06155 [Anaerolineaceae bacterium]|nr:hypothetical protein [Anaerolineaceae bacterium]